MQYKFFVDGEWRHDEHQPFVSGNYGVVNTIFLPREPDVVPAVFSPDTPGGSNMDLDNDPFPRGEVIPRISEADLEVSRHRVSEFLSTHIAYELLPESGKVIALDVNLPVKQAFHTLYEQGIPVAPLWDFCKGQFVGVLSALDFILILREVCPSLEANGGGIAIEALPLGAAAAMIRKEIDAFPLGAAMIRKAIDVCPL
ncbi:Sucrose nonfermenting 4-like protein [Vitis vinifera]|uniref:Sucrose nonfermenting 4-like protein n=1 Tax=Vitis vinifera TaxID=29760 RepID=A0A438EZN0_VITVI|nr:Sucrose nonfermenting 4-like protein [Vitis vinifera]